jgi:hypothetical protein
VGRVSVREALWWLGGVPRFLEYFLADAAAAAGLPAHSGPRAALAAYINGLEPSGAANLVSSLVSSLEARQWGRCMAPAYVLEDAFCLSVAETRVPRASTLGGSAAGGAEGGVSAQDAQRQGLLYWRPRGEAGLGVIELPSLVLLWWQLQQQKQRWPGPSRPLSAMHCFVPFPFLRDSEGIEVSDSEGFVPSLCDSPSLRDSEGLAVSVLLHKARAAALVGKDTVTLSSLGIPVHPSLVPDATVPLLCACPAAPLRSAPMAA